MRSSTWPAAIRSARVSSTAPAQPATIQAPAAAWGNGVASPGGTPESRSAAQPAGSSPAGAQRPVAFTARPEAPAPSIWEWRDDSVPASEPPPAAQPAAPAGEPVPPRGEGAAGPPSATERKPPQTPTSTGGQSPVKDQPPVKGQPSVEDETPEKKQLSAQAQPSAQARPSVQAQPPADRHDDAKPAASANEPDLAPVASVASIATEAPASPQSGQANQTAEPEKAADAEQAAEPEPAGPDPNMEITVVPGVPRYHNARCILIRFMGENDLDKMTLAAAREIGCTPCRACLPDEPNRSPE